MDFKNVLLNFKNLFIFVFLEVNVFNIHDRYVIYKELGPFFNVFDCHGVLISVISLWSYWSS